MNFASRTVIGPICTSGKTAHSTVVYRSNLNARPGSRGSCSLCAILLVTTLWLAPGSIRILACRGYRSVLRLRLDSRHEVGMGFRGNQLRGIRQHADVSTQID